MIATAMSPVEDLLVVRELRAMLPNLARLGSSVQKNLSLVAQLAGESYVSFAARVMARAERDSKLGRAPRTVFVSVDAMATKERLESRERLVTSLARLLGGGPNFALVIQAPANCDASVQCSLFELVEAVTRAVPSLSVRLTFENTMGRNQFQLERPEGPRRPADTHGAAAWS